MGHPVGLDVLLDLRSPDDSIYITKFTYAIGGKHANQSRLAGRSAGGKQRQLL